MSTVTFRGIPMEASSVSHAASLRLSEMQEEAHRRAAELVPGQFWTSGLSVVLVALSGQGVGTMTPARAQGIIAAATAIWAALQAAEAQVQAVLDGEGTDAEKIAAIDAVSVAWPENA